MKELKTIWGNPYERDYICHLILALPKTYESVVAAFETLDFHTLNVEFVKSRLLNECRRRKLTFTGKLSFGSWNRMRALCLNVTGVDWRVTKKCTTTPQYSNYKFNDVKDNFNCHVQVSWTVKFQLMLW